MSLTCASCSSKGPRPLEEARVMRWSVEMAGARSVFVLMEKDGQRHAPITARSVLAPRSPDQTELSGRSNPFPTVPRPRAVDWTYFRPCGLDRSRKFCEGIRSEKAVEPADGMRWDNGLPAVDHTITNEDPQISHRLGFSFFTFDWTVLEIGETGTVGASLVDGRDEEWTGTGCRLAQGARTHSLLCAVRDGRETSEK